MLIFEIKDGVLIKYHGYQTHVTIPDGVTRIAKKAFSNRKENIESLVIPESVTEIDGRSFMDFPGLRSVTLPGSVKAIAARTYLPSRLQSTSLFL